jgi:hypothetical protein
MSHIKTELPQQHLMQLDSNNFGYNMDPFDPCYGSLSDPQQQQQQQQLIVLSSDQMMENEMIDHNQPSTSKLSATSSSSSTSSKKRGCFPKSATNKLKHWLFQNLAVMFLSDFCTTHKHVYFYVLIFLLAVTFAFVFNFNLIFFAIFIAHFSLAV